jgi:methionyl-tRNA formyltransferase
MAMILIANSNIIHKSLEDKCITTLGARTIHLKEELNAADLASLSPTYIFFPHWSYIIPRDVYEQFTCVVFHMTDLPYGRGGSPLQNLILRGHEKTKISALKVEEGIDTGGIYLKRNLSLSGTAEEIYLRSGEIMYEMICEIVNKKLQPVSQSGEVVVFKRRKPEESNIEGIQTREALYDFIRMLDAEGYPHAYLENEHFRFEFTRASFKKESIVADVRIIKK